MLTDSANELGTECYRTDIIVILLQTVGASQLQKCLSLHDHPRK